MVRTPVKSEYRIKIGNTYYSFRIFSEAKQTAINAVYKGIEIAYVEGTGNFYYEYYLNTHMLIRSRKIHGELP